MCSFPENQIIYPDVGLKVERVGYRAEHTFRRITKSHFPDF